MNRIQKRKLSKIKARQNKIRRFGGLKHGYNGYQIDCYVYHLLDLLKK